MALITPGPRSLPRMVGEKGDDLVAVEIGDRTKVVKIRKINAAIVIDGVAIELQQAIIGIGGDNMVVDDVEDNRQTALMALIDEETKIVRIAIRDFGRKEI